MAETKTKTYTISTMAKICGVSVPSVSALIKKRGFKPVKTGSHNAKYFDSKVKDAVVNHYQGKRKTKTKTAGSEQDDVIVGLRELVAEQRDMIDLLKRQLAIKDKQIEMATTLANQAQQLDLVKHGKLIEKESENVSEEVQSKKSFWKKFFG